MQNFVKPGKTCTFIAPSGGVVSGTAYLIGALLVVACESADAAAEFEGMVEGIFVLPKTDSQAWTQGQKLYWNDAALPTGQRCTNVATDGQLIGVASAAVAVTTGLVTGRVRLNGVAPSALEGPQAAEADLVDNSGGTTADGTIAVVTAPTALTDNSGGGAADNIVAAVAATAGSCGGSTTPSATNVDTAIATAVASIVTGVNSNFKELATTQIANRAALVALTDAIKELSTKENALLAKLRIAGIIA